MQKFLLTLSVLDFRCPSTNVSLLDLGVLTNHIWYVISSTCCFPLFYKFISNNYDFLSIYLILWEVLFLLSFCYNNWLVFLTYTHFNSIVHCSLCVYCNVFIVYSGTLFVIFVLVLVSKDFTGFAKGFQTFLLTRASPLCVFPGVFPFPFFKVLPPFLPLDLLNSFPFFDTTFFFEFLSLPALEAVFLPITFFAVPFFAVLFLAGPFLAVVRGFLLTGRSGFPSSSSSLSAEQHEQRGLQQPPPVSLSSSYTRFLLERQQN